MYAEQFEPLLSVAMPSKSRHVAASARARVTITAPCSVGGAAGPKWERRCGVAVDGGCVCGMSMAKSTGSHCGEQAWTGSCVFELCEKAATESGLGLGLRGPQALRTRPETAPSHSDMLVTGNRQHGGMVSHPLAVPQRRGLREAGAEDGSDAENEECAEAHGALPRLVGPVWAHV